MLDSCKYNFILQSGCNQTKILIWGEAGVGKTSFCEKISQDWALVVTGREGTELDKLTEEQRCKLNNIGLLFYIVLRETNSDQTLEQILTSQFELQLDHLDYFKSYTGNVTVILDGFDELSYNTGHIIKLIQGKIHKNIQYIVTCRPHASQDIVLRADTEIRLKGFSESQSKAFIVMFARNRFKQEKDVDLFVSKTWKEITSSVDLIEMSTNPSMLQLICLLSAQTRKIGKDRADVFKHYTQYLLIQYHSKHNKGVPYSDKLYKDALLKCGRLAMFGLKQNHLQLVFSKQEATEVAGSLIFDLGFLTELPSIDPDQVKVQFTHKSLQEYLAAFYVVNTSADEGMKVLMEFCSTSQRLMGSQIILSFIIAMSTKMGNVIQNQIRDYISPWASNDDVDPKSRTSFLIAMLKDNKTLTFPLPAVLDIDLQVYDLVSKRIKHFIKSLFRQSSSLERFLNMDGRGVKKIDLGVGQYNRLGLLLNNSFKAVDEILINYKNTWSKEDPAHLTRFITTNKPSLISITNCVDSLFNTDLITKVILTPHVHTVILKKCQISKDNCLLILQGGHRLKSLIIHECGIEIDAEIAKAVCGLPDETNVDLSGNKIVKMSTKLLASLIVKINKQKRIDLSGLNIDIDNEISKAVCDLPDETQIDLSGNQVNRLDRIMLELIVTQIRKEKESNVTRFNFQVDSNLVNAIYEIPGDRELDLSKNKIFQINPRILMTLIYKIQSIREIDMSGLNINIDTELVKCITELPEDVQIDLSDNKITKMEVRLVGKVLKYMKKQKGIDLSGLNIDIDAELVKCISELPEGVQIDLSDNKITDESLIVSIIKQSTKLKSVTIRNCGIKINKQIAEAVSELNDDTKLDLSGNEITWRERLEAGLLVKVLKYMKKQEKIGIAGWGKTIDVDIVKALSNMVYLKSLGLSGSTSTPSACKCLVQSVRSLPQLEGLYLGRCDISNDDCVDLVSSLSKHCPMLEVLYLSNNHLSSGYSQVVDDVSKMNNLRELRLRGNPCMEDRKKREEIKNRLKISNPHLKVY